MNISIVIPCLNAFSTLVPLISSLRCQTIFPGEIIIIDSESNDGTFQLAGNLGCPVLSIKRSDFNHGGTRNLASIHAQGEILIFMTQDALPVDRFFLQHLIDPIFSGKAVASFARQVPYPNASVGERFARLFNYPPVSQIRSKSSNETMNLDAYFFSNVASAIRKDIFIEVGMFADDVIMNEDMLMCAKLLNAGYSVAYTADAQVYHSHDYTLQQTFKRYFDIGVFFARHFHVMNLSTSGRGVDFSRQLISEMVQLGAWCALFHAFLEIGTKFAGFKLGKMEKFIPVVLKRRLSMHVGYWDSTAQKKAAF